MRPAPVNPRRPRTQRSSRVPGDLSSSCAASPAVADPQETAAPPPDQPRLHLYSCAADTFSPRLPYTARQTLPAPCLLAPPTVPLPARPGAAAARRSALPPRPSTPVPPRARPLRAIPSRLLALCEQASFLLPLNSPPIVPACGRHANLWMHRGAGAECKKRGWCVWPAARMCALLYEPRLPSPPPHALPPARLCLPPVWRLSVPGAPFRAALAPLCICPCTLCTSSARLHLSATRRLHAHAHAHTQILIAASLCMQLWRDARSTCGQAPIPHIAGGLTSPPMHRHAAGLVFAYAVSIRG